MSAGEEARRPLLSGYESSSDSGNVYNGEAATAAPAAPGKTNQEYNSLLASINGEEIGFQEMISPDDVLTVNPTYYYGLLSNISVNKDGETITPEQANQLYAALSEKPVYKGRRLKKRIMDDLKMV